MPIISKICPNCHKPFQTWQRPKHQQRYCSKACAMQYRWRDYQPKSKASRKRYPGICQHCGKGFLGNRKQAHFCSRQCAGTARWASESFRQKMKPLFKRTDLQRQVASKRMKRLNKDPIIRAKSAATLRGRSFSGERGGNGQLTREQLLLAKALGWPTEYSIPTGNLSWRSATVDLAYPKLRIAVECDGASHHTRKQKNRDRRKEQMLKDMGWELLRFWNSQITGNLDWVIETIQRCVQARSLELSRSQVS